MLTYQPEKVEWKPSTVKEVQPLTLDTTTVRDWGEPPLGTKIRNNVMSDIRKKANPHSRDYYTYGKI